MSGLPADETGEMAPTVELLRDLQQAASEYADLTTTDYLLMETRIVYATGVALPWRLMETQSRVVDDVTQRQRRMHCFRSVDTLWACLRERIGWRRADADLVRRYETGAVFRQDESVLPMAQARERLRLRLVHTWPDRTQRIDRP